jgi:hypothetical protein
MDTNPLGFLELLIVLGCALGWGVLELVALRLDKRRASEAERADLRDDASG